MSQHVFDQLGVIQLRVVLDILELPVVLDDNREQVLAQIVIWYEITGPVVVG